MNVLNINQKIKPKVLLVLPQGIPDVSKIFVNYIKPLGDIGQYVHVVNVEVSKKGRMSKKVFEPINNEVKEYCELNGISIIATPIGELLRNFLKSSKSYPLERNIGTAHITEDYTYVPLLNFLVLKFAPGKKNLLQRGVSTLETVMKEEYKDNTKEFLDNTKITHPKTIKEAKEALKLLLEYDKLTCDIETTGLVWHKDTLLSISFSYSETEAVVIDFKNLKEKGLSLLKNFLVKYKGYLIFQNVVFDVPFLVYKLFMKDLDDYAGMLEGVNSFKLDDTMIMAWLCLNSTTKPVLGLKELAFSKFGAYDDNIEQSKLSCYPIEEVARYNAIDTMATYYVYNKYFNKLKEENQQELYLNFYRKVIPSIIKIKMTGLTLDKEKVYKAYEILDNEIETATSKLQEFESVKKCRKELNKIACKKYNDSHVGQKTVEYFDVVFNPNSTIQKRILLFDIMLFNPTKFTETKQPSTDKEVLQELFVQTSNEEYKEILELLLNIADASIIRNTFVRNGFINSEVETPKGEYKLFGNYNITGTQTGRLSSNRINLQNLPSTGSKYAELIKECIIAPKGFIIGHLDFSNLEERVMASLANCKAKQRIFTEGVDSHSINASVYFKDELKNRGIEVDINSKESVNSIKKLAPDLRQKGKSCSFAMNYNSTHIAIQNALKCSEAEAKEIFNAYHELYYELDDFMEETIHLAKTQGYVTGFFGLKLRTPDINAEDKGKAGSVARSINNMRIQSAALLTLKSIYEFQELVEKSEFKYDIRVHATVYDSIYLFIKPNVKAIKFVKDNLIPIMCQEYDGQIIPNEAELDLGNSWNEEITVTNEDEIKQTLNKLVV